MPEVSRSLVPQTEVGPNYFAYHIREIEELFRQEDFIPSLSSKAFARTGEDVKDNNNVDNNLYESREAAGPSSRALFDKSLGDNLSLYTNDRLKASIKQGATVLSQEVDEMLHPVIRMYKIRKYLTDHERVANNPSTADRHVNQSAYKKQKLFSSPSPTAVATPFGSQSCEGTSGSESMDTKDPNIVSSGESQSRGRNRVCIDCKTTNSPQWRLGPTGARNLCNACGLRYKKKKLSPSGIIKAEDTLKQEADELQILVSAGGSYAKETVKKYSDEFFAKLEDMEQQLEKYLNVIMSKCRMMTREEKQELRRLIQNLPPKNLDRVVEIIVQHRKLPEGHPCDEIHIDLEEEDNVTLWRLYYYVKAVENAKAKSDE